MDKMRAGRCPGLPCLLAVATLLAAPACLAQQATAAAPADGAELDALVENPHAEPANDQRSAFGRVMSIMIAALKQNADQPLPLQPDAPPGLRPDGIEASPARDIQVSAAFRLDPAPSAPDATPVTASID